LVNCSGGCACSSSGGNGDADPAFMASLMYIRTYSFIIKVEALIITGKA